MLIYKSVCHLTSVHARSDVRIFLKECCSLANEGYKISLVVADGKGDEVKRGVSIFDVGASRGRIGRMCCTVLRMFKKASFLDADIYHLHDPELLPLGLALAWHGAKVVYDSHEDVPRQILSKHWIPFFLRRTVSVAFECFEDGIARRLTGIVAATPHIAKRFKRINSNTIDIKNFPFLNELAPASEMRCRGRTVCYIGGISRVRGLRSLVEALPLVPDIRMVLCGKFSEEDFESELRSLPGWTQIAYLGHVDREGVREAMANSFAGFVTLLPTPAYLDSLPIKMFEYMSAELPVIASNFPMWRQIINEAGAGLCVDPDSPEAIAAAIRRLANDPVLVEQFGKAGREAVLTKYNWPSEAEKLVNFYKGLS